MKIIVTAIVLALTSTAAMAGSTTHVTHDGTNYGTGNNGKFVALAAPTGSIGATGAKGAKGKRGHRGRTGSNGSAGTDGSDGSDGKNAVAPLGSLSFAAASSSFYGDGIGFGLSASTYSDIEGSIVIGFDLGSNWRAVAGITTDFNKRTAGSVGVGFSF